MLPFLPVPRQSPPTNHFLMTTTIILANNFSLATTRNPNSVDHIQYDIKTAMLWILSNITRLLKPQRFFLRPGWWSFFPKSYFGPFSHGAHPPFLFSSPGEFVVSVSHGGMRQGSITCFLLALFCSSVQIGTCFFFEIQEIGPAVVRQGSALTNRGVLSRVSIVDFFLAQKLGDFF